MNALYNEIDPYACDWTESLIRAGHIAHGVVERRSIIDLRIEDVAGFTQAHFFAGIGVWSGALRLAGWPDDREVWTGSCPCQPYSVAGKGKGVSDERHLWPDWFRLIEQRRPAAIFGEQVASKPALAWLDTVRAQLEGAGYSFGAADLASAGVGAPHIRQRLYFCAFRTDGLAYPNGSAGGQGSPLLRGGAQGSDAGTGTGFGGGGGARGLANNNNNGCQKHGRELLRDEVRDEVRTAVGDYAPVGPGEAGRVVDDDDERPQGYGGNGDGGDQPRRIRAEQAGSIGAAGATRGFWAGADWLPCRDEKWRPVESGTFPLAHGAPSRVGRLRAYGNTINIHLAAAFVRSALEAFTSTPVVAGAETPGNG